MKIHKKESFGVISDESKPEVKYCPFCAKYDIKSVLQPRRNYDLSDKHLWRECYRCYRIIPIHHAMQRRGLTGTIEPVNNPFYEQENRLIGSGNKHRKDDKFERMRKEIEAEKDLDIRQELGKGNSVTIIAADDPE